MDLSSFFASLFVIFDLFLSNFRPIQDFLKVNCYMEHLLRLSECEIGCLKCQKGYIFKENNTGFHNIITHAIFKNLWHSEMDPEIRKLVVEIVEPHKTNNILITKHCRTYWFFHHCAQFKKVSSALSCTLSKSTDWNFLLYQAELRVQFNSRLYDRLYIHCGALLWWRQLGLLGLLWVTNRVFKFRELRTKTISDFKK